MSPAKLILKQDVTSALRRTLVEVFTLRNAGRPMTDASNALDYGIIPDTESVKITVSKDGEGLSLTYPDQKTLNDILTATEPGLQEIFQPPESEEELQTGSVNPQQVAAKEETQPLSEDVAEDATKESGAISEHPRQDEDMSWLGIPLQDPKIKFAVRCLHSPSIFLDQSLTRS